MRTKEILIIAGAIALGCVVAAGLRPEFFLLAQIAPRKAFTVTEIVSLRDAEGTERFVQMVTFAQRRDGSTARRERSSGFGKLGVVAEDITVVHDAGKRIVARVDAIAESVTSQPMTEEEVRFRKGVPDGSCEPPPSPERIFVGVAQDPQTPELLGYPVVKATERFQVANGVKELQRWVSPDLECYALRGVVANLGEVQPGRRGFDSRYRAIRSRGRSGRSAF